MTEQINQYLNQISENTETIAENQQKVYDAGRIAGKMEDVDYQDGYKDGYVAGTNTVGNGIIESIINGETPVGKAVEADKATFAYNAERASTADAANKATEADIAHHAELATTADTAGHADFATDASHAAQADNATTADHAESATHATSASTATSSTYAEHATEASYADVAGRASSVVANGTVSAVQAGTVGGYPYYKISIALDVKPKLLVFANQTHQTQVLCIGNTFVYTEDGYVGAGATSFDNNTFSFTLPVVNGVGVGGGTWQYVAMI